MSSRPKGGPMGGGPGRDVGAKRQKTKKFLENSETFISVHV